MSNFDLLSKVGQSSEETEFYTPMPAGYRKGHHKYVVVVGTVMSGLGKGIFSSSLAKTASSGADSGASTTGAATGCAASTLSAGAASGVARDSKPETRFKRG